MEVAKIYVVHKKAGYTIDSYDVSEDIISDIEQALSLGGVLHEALLRGHITNWYLNPLDAYKEAVKLNVDAIKEFNDFSEDGAANGERMEADMADDCSTSCPGECSGCGCGCCDDDEECPEDCADCHDCDEYELSMEEYPSKLVYFPTKETINLFKRKESDKESRYCVFITEQTVEDFKKAATNKSNYSLSKKANTTLFNEWLAFVNP